MFLFEMIKNVTKKSQTGFLSRILESIYRFEKNETGLFSAKNQFLNCILATEKYVLEFRKSYTRYLKDNLIYSL